MGRRPREFLLIKTYNLLTNFQALNPLAKELSESLSGGESLQSLSK
jgi:hypothetical protein